MKKWSEQKLKNYICHNWGIKEHKSKVPTGTYPDLLWDFCKCFHTEVIEEYKNWFDKNFRNPHQAISYFLPNDPELHPNHCQQNQRDHKTSNPQD